MLWFFFSFICLISAFLGEKRFSSSYLFFRIILILALSLFAGLGGIVSTDHDNYAQIFRTITKYDLASIFKLSSFNPFSDKDNTEAGYLLLNWIIHKLGFSEPMFFIIISIIMNTLVVNIIYRYKYPVFSVLLFIVSTSYFQETNIVRQMLAAYIFLYAVKFLENRQPLQYILTVMLASTFHTSALVLIPFVVFAYLDLSKYSKIVTAVLLALCFFSLVVMQGIISLEVLDNLSSITYYDIYTNNLEGIGHEENPFELEYNVIVIFVLIFLFFSKTKKSNSFYLRLTIITIGLFFSNIAIPYYWFYRIAMYFVPLYYFFIPEIMSKISFRNSKRDHSSVTIPLCVIVLWNLLDLIRNFILNKNVVLGSKFYPLSSL